MENRGGDEDKITAFALAAGRGDARALTDFIRATQNDVWRFVRFLSDDRHADDLTQETYLRAVKSLPRFSGRSTARTWLLSIARRVVVDHIRYETSRPRMDLHGSSETIASITSLTERHDDNVELRMLIDALDEPRREALVLTQILGMSYVEAAAVCGCPVGTIRSRVARARDDLQAAYRAGEHRTTG